MRIRIFLVSMTLLVSPMLPGQDVEPAFDLSGTWIGWVWLGDAGDLPFQIRIAPTQRTVEASFDSPAHPLNAVPFGSVEWKRPTLTMTGEIEAGTRVRMSGTLRGNELAGAIEWGRHRGEFELTRSPRPIARVSPTTYASATGFYERARGDLVELRARPWGEMLYRELRTGRVRTLLPLGDDRFFIGSGIYDPHPVEAEIELVRGAHGRVVALVETRNHAAERRATKLSLVEEIVSFPSGDARLTGTLLRRAESVGQPGLVLLGGSAWETRQDISFHARNLAALGFAVLSFDRRGFGESTGERTVPFATTAGDALAGVRLLRKTRGIDPSRVGVLGMSRGAWQAPLTASGTNEVSFLILLVPPAVSPAAQETRSRIDQMRRDGFDEARIALASKLLSSTWRWVRKQDNWNEYSTLRTTAAAAGIPDYVLESDSPEPEPWKWARLNMHFDPCPVLGTLTIPVLAVFAEKDIHVSEAVNRPRLQQCVGKRARLTTRTLRSAHHDLSVPNDFRVHEQPGRGDEGFSFMADWAIRELGLGR